MYVLREVKYDNKEIPHVGYSVLETDETFSLLNDKNLKFSVYNLDNKGILNNLTAIDLAKLCDDNINNCLGITKNDYMLLCSKTHKHLWDLINIVDNPIELDYVNDLNSSINKHFGNCHKVEESQHGSLYHSVHNFSIFVYNTDNAYSKFDNLGHFWKVAYPLTKAEDDFSSMSGEITRYIDLLEFYMHVFSKVQDFSFNYLVVYNKTLKRLVQLDMNREVRRLLIKERILGE